MPKYGGEEDPCVCLMADLRRAEVLPVDVGIASQIWLERVFWTERSPGEPGNFPKEPAMTREETVKALEVGIEATEDLTYMKEVMIWQEQGEWE